MHKLEYSFHLGPVVKVDGRRLEKKKLAWSSHEYFDIKCTPGGLNSILIQVLVCDGTKYIPTI